MASTQFTSTLNREEEKLLACIHCGLCLEACPTYVVTGDENDGPRGRLYLMRAVSEDRLSTSAKTFERHIDRCLGCRACEAVCPAGVQYGELLEASRAELFNLQAKRGVVYDLLRFVLRDVWLKPKRLRFAFNLARFVRDSGVARVLLKSKIARVFSKRFEFSLALLESSRPGLGDSARAHDSVAGKVTKERRALLFKACVTDGLFARVNAATKRVLAVNGYSVLVPENQVCCGALHAHAGDLESARKLARQNISAFGNEDASIVTNAGGCGAMLISYKHLLAGDEAFAALAHKFSARVRDLSQELASRPMVKGAPVDNKRITYDASCHLLYGQGAAEEPLQLLKSIPDVNFVPLPGSERCCGGAGIYNLVERELSNDVLAQKLAAIKETGAEVVVTGNAGCHMQIGAGALLENEPVKVLHPVELLDESYRRAGMYE